MGQVYLHAGMLDRLVASRGRLADCLPFVPRDVFGRDHLGAAQEQLSTDILGVDLVVESLRAIPTFSRSSRPIFSTRFNLSISQRLY